MKTIDFLPERYRQAKKRRYTSYYRLAVTVFFIVAFAGAAGELHYKQHEIRKQSEQVNNQFAAAQAKSNLLASKQAELEKISVYAAVVTHLRHPWPRSRVLADLTEPLPEEVALTRIELRTAPREIVRTGEAASTGDTGEPKQPDIHTDLATLREQAEAEMVLIDLEGSTTDQTSLHLYLRALLASPLIHTAELTQVEAAAQSSDVTVTETVRTDRFTAVVKLRPGWGLSGGPQTEPEVAPPATTEATAVVSPAERSRS
jgi:Tfp pilus assembly protein PilN